MPPSTASQAWRRASTVGLAGARHAEHQQRRGGVRHDLALALGEALERCRHIPRVRSRMASSTTSLEYDWLGACRRSVEGVRAVLAQSAPGPERVEETGVVGVGGDRTLVIDQRAEDLVIGELRALHDEGARFTLVSEECGVLDFGDPGTRRRRRPDRRLAERQARPARTTRCRSRSPTGRRWPTSCSATSTTSAPARSGAPSAAPGRGSTARRSSAVPPERRTADGRLEVVAVESAAPRWLAASSDALLRQRPPRARARLDRDLAVPGRRRRAPTRWPRCAPAARSTPPRRS